MSCALLAAFYLGGAVATLAQRLQSYHTMKPEERQKFREVGRPGFSIAVQTVGWPAFALLILGWYGLPECGETIDHVVRREGEGPRRCPECEADLEDHIEDV